MWNEFDLSPKLTVVSGPMQGVTFRLGRGRWVIGRDSAADILIDDRKISRQHAAVECDRGRAVLTDTGSTNGTWVNDQRVTEGHELRDGDRIKMGHVALRFFDPSAATTDPVGTLRCAPGRPAAGAAVSLAPAGAAPITANRVMPGAGRSGRALLTVGCCLAVAGWLAWAYLLG